MKKLGAKALKGLDQDRYQMLTNANSRLDADKQLAFYFCHASLIIDAYDVTGYETESGYIDPRYPYEWEENERKLQITNWYDVNGKAVFNSSRFKLDHFDKVFNLGANTSDPVDLKDESAWGKHTLEKLGGWAGNEGVTKTTTYSKYLLVVWPKQFELETILKMDLKLVIESLYELLVNKKQNLNDLKQREFRSVIKALDNDPKKNKKKLTDAHIVALIELLVIFNDIELVDKFFSKVNVEMNTFNSSKLADLVHRFGEERVKKHLKQIIKSDVNLLVPNCGFILVINSCFIEIY